MSMVISCVYQYFKNFEAIEDQLRKFAFTAIGGDLKIMNSIANEYTDHLPESLSLPGMYQMWQDSVVSEAHLKDFPQYG